MPFVLNTANDDAPICDCGCGIQLVAPDEEGQSQPPQQPTQLPSLLLDKTDIDEQTNAGGWNQQQQHIVSCTPTGTAISGPTNSCTTANTKVATSGGHANTQAPSKRSSSGADGDYQLVQHEVLYSLSAEYEVSDEQIFDYLDENAFNWELCSMVFVIWNYPFYGIHRTYKRWLKSRSTVFFLQFRSARTRPDKGCMCLRVCETIGVTTMLLHCFVVYINLKLSSPYCAGVAPLAVYAKVKRASLSWGSTSKSCVRQKAQQPIECCERSRYN